MSGGVLYKYSVTLQTILLVRTFFSFSCPAFGNDYLHVMLQLLPNDAFVGLQLQYIVSWTRFIIFLIIVQTVEIASFAASTHCLEDFALLCVDHNHTQIHFFLNHFLY